ncbi:MarR family transcriptional regulator [Microcella daejeonensis]|uniref:MarR family winged helix-turn-helix transcriptional regulator n=1 Tax=Microcella daejeonensis TaxID=2994971 RepID=UPI00226E87E6|nr:MarR family transcriptional regulator [Microcella daejeonensis]WAB85222.1 MarR family transcriptional regulator [Microcella daejeonensis]
MAHGSGSAAAPSGQPLDHVARIQAEWARERPDLDVSPQGVIGRLHRLAAHLTEELAAVFDDFEFSAGEFDVLAALRRAGTPFERSPSELAETTMITSGGLSKRLDRLESAGLIERRILEGDRRQRVVALTATGRSVIDRAIEAHLENERRLLSVLSAEERAAIEALLARWMRVADDAPPRTVPG